MSSKMIVQFEEMKKKKTKNLVRRSMRMRSISFEFFDWLNQLALHHYFHANLFVYSLFLSIIILSSFSCANCVKWTNQSHQPILILNPCFTYFVLSETICTRYSRGGVSQFISFLSFVTTWKVFWFYHELCFGQGQKKNSDRISKWLRSFVHSVDFTGTMKGLQEFFAEVNDNDQHTFQSISAFLSSSIHQLQLINQTLDLLNKHPLYQ